MTEQIVMDIIVQAGEAKGYAYEALRKANAGEYQEAAELMEQAAEAISKTHAAQTALLQKEASGESVGVSILLVHAQDHLMSAITEKNLITEMIELRKVVNALTGQKEVVKIN